MRMGRGVDACRHGQCISGTSFRRAERRWTAGLALCVAVAVLAAPAAARASPTIGPSEHRDRPQLFFDGILWDLSDDGLAFRLTATLPAAHDPFTRWLGADESRWTASIGYAKSYNRFDTHGEVVEWPGGHSLMVSAGRQTLWRWPGATNPWIPRFELEGGVNYATHRFKANSTKGNFKVITGLEWTLATPGRAAVWSAGLRWFHLSNAGLLRRNAGYDGLMFRFGRELHF
jgi:hypothetical protein